MKIRFTCNACGFRSARAINPHALATGTVFVQCEGCAVHHKLVDNLNLFHEMQARSSPRRLPLRVADDRRRSAAPVSPQGPVYAAPPPADAAFSPGMRLGGFDFLVRARLSRAPWRGEQRTPNAPYAVGSRSRAAAAVPFGRPPVRRGAEDERGASAGAPAPAQDGGAA